MKLIIVENNDDQITTYRDTIVALNASGGDPIEDPRVVKTLAEALVAIENEHFDAAIVDLKLSGNQSETQGNEVIRQIVSLKRFPIFVYSSYIGDIDPAIEQSFFFQHFEKTIIPFRDIVIKLRDIYKTGVTKILGRNGTIESYLTKIFWKHIADSFEDLCRKGITQGQLLRYIIGHLYEHLELSEVDGSFEKYLPEEVYIRPSIKQKFFTGSIIKEKNSETRFIILTPACDIANGKAKHILLVSVQSLNADPVRCLRVKATEPILPGLDFQGREDEKNQAKENLDKLIRNNYSNKYYFLPNSENFEGGLINFQDIESVDMRNMNDRFDIVATVNNQFLKDIVAKFSFYYSRQGAPEIEFSIANLP